jgi:hypothetical protein
VARSHLPCFGFLFLLEGFSMPLIRTHHTEDGLWFCLTDVLCEIGAILKPQDAALLVKRHVGEDSALVTLFYPRRGPDENAVEAHYRITVDAVKYLVKHFGVRHSDG